jgi:uncharacterized protein
MIKVNLSTLIHAKVGGRETVVLDLDKTFVDDLDLGHLAGELHLTRVAHGILVEAVLHTEVLVECTRCLAPFYTPVIIELEDDIISLPGLELTPERPIRVAEDGWTDLSPLIREYAWISLPVNPMCSPDCKGICPTCGGNVNLGKCDCESAPPIDPRWEALRTLVE